MDAVSAPVPVTVPVVEAVAVPAPAPEGVVAAPAPEGQDAMLDYTVQDGDTAEMTWDVAELVKFVDERSRFESGDVMFTGSPAGTGQGSGKFLKPGDVVEAEIPGIGLLRNIVTTAQ